MQPLISVIVPVYNVEKYLYRCVKSIVNQTYENLEIILVDDGSPDNCPKMCDEWAEKDSRIKVIHKENGGVSSARNTALDCVSGDYTVFIDADDYIDPDMLKILYDKAAAENADIVACNLVYVNDNEEPFKISWYTDAAAAGNEEVLKAYFSDVFIAPGCPTKLYRTEVINGNKHRFPLNIKIGEDFLFNFYVFSDCQKIVHIKDGLYFYYMRDDSAIHTATEPMINRWKNTKSVMKDINSQQVYNACLIKYCNELLCCVRELLKTGDKKLIKQCYNGIAQEIKDNRKSFKAVGGLSGFQLLSVYAISFSPLLFKTFYSFYINHLKKD